MGESDTAMDYDEDLIFKHLCVLLHYFFHCFFPPWLISNRCFYLDTPDNARKNDMVTKSKHENDIIKKQVHFQ